MITVGGYRYFSVLADKVENTKLPFYLITTFYYSSFLQSP